MPQRLLVSSELASILSVIAHPHRIRIIEELGAKEKDVQTLTEELGLQQATVSQHLAQLRSKGIVEARREGHHVFYSLKKPWLAGWLVDGFQLLDLQAGQSAEIAAAAKAVRKLWKVKEPRA